MGTRADFYTGGTDPATMRWLGSIAFDGYPDGLPPIMLVAEYEQQWETYVEAFLDTRDDATLPEQGWPWPWPDSRTTDYAYTWDGQRVVACAFANAWWPAAGGEPESTETVAFPDMTAVQNIAWGRRSGLIVIATEEPEP